jgi:tetratricopeptide (TPR) repeat protein
MEKPEGEIFIIPARLEECNTLESLRHLHWVDLFEEDGYEKLTQALSLRAEQVGASINRKFVLKADTGRFTVVGQAATLSNLGSVRQQMGDFSKAIEYYEQALMLSQELGDRKAEVTMLNNLGSAYESVGDLIRATELYEHALLISKEIGW